MSANPNYGAGQQSESDYLAPYMGYNPNAIDPIIQKQTAAFTQTFQNLMGRQPTPDEINGYFQQQYAGQAHPDLIDPYNSAQSYTVNAFGPDIAKYNQQQSTDQLTKSQGLVQDLINKTMGNTASQFSDPNSNLYQSFSGAMNNMGISPSSGAFQAGAGSTIANSGLDAANNALQQIGIPAISGIQNTTGNPYQMSMGAPQEFYSRQNEMQDFMMQSQLAQQLAQMSGGSGAQNMLGMASSSAQGAGNLLQGGAAAKKATWICTAMRRAGVLSSAEISLLHDHLFRAFWRRPLKFLGYWTFGKLLVLLAESAGTDWRVWRSEFYDRVIEEPDPAKAVDLYESAFWDLYRNVRIRSRLVTP